jgi:hypothetical protein
MTETTITNAIKAFLKTEGFRPIKIHGGPYQEIGLPDILAVERGTGAAWWFEVKRPGCTTTAIQNLKIDELRLCGCPVFVVTSVDETRQSIAEHRRGNQST